MLKVGVFGVGHLGKFHLNNWKEIDGVELVGFYDPSDENAMAVKEKYGLKRFKNVADLIEACDVVDIVAPTIAHHELCKMAILKKQTCICRKTTCQYNAGSKGTCEAYQRSQYKIPGGPCGKI